MDMDPPIMDIESVTAVSVMEDITRGQLTLMHSMEAVDMDLVIMAMDILAMVDIQPTMLDMDLVIVSTVSVMVGMDLEVTEVSSMGDMDLEVMEVLAMVDMDMAHMDIMGKY